MKEKTEVQLQVQQGQDVRQLKKFKISLPEIPKGLKIFLSLLGAVILSALVLLFGYHVSYRYWLNQMGDGAYKYSDKVYELIEEKISECMPREVGPDIRSLQEFLANPGIVDEAVTTEQASTLDETKSEEETTEPPEAMDEEETAMHSEWIGKYSSIYENGQTTMISSLQNGYFKAEVTVTLDSHFAIIKSYRNFNSREDYMYSFWNDLELRVFESTLLIYAAVVVFTFGFFGSIALIYFKVKTKKEKNAEKVTAPQEELLNQA